MYERAKYVAAVSSQMYSSRDDGGQEQSIFLWDTRRSTLSNPSSQSIAFTSWCPRVSTRGTRSQAPDCLKTTASTTATASAKRPWSGRSGSPAILPQDREAARCRRSGRGVIRPAHQPALSSLRLPSLPAFFFLYSPNFSRRSRLHLVDAELHAYKGREHQLLRRYEREFDPVPIATSRRKSGGGGRGSGRGDGRGGGTGAVRRQLDPPRQRVPSVVERAQEEEARRVQANLETSLARIMSRKASRR